jgi:membrane protease YdiL (CAAX protease family)
VNGSLPPPPPPPVPPIPAPQLAPELEQVPWRAREAVLVLLLAFLTGALGSMIIGSAVRDDTVAQLGFVAVLEGAVGFWVIVWARVRHRATPALLGLRVRMADLGVGALAGLLGVVVTAAITQVVLALAREIVGGGVKAPEQLPSDLDGTGPILLAGLVVVVVAPVAEELLFRGFIYQALRRWRGVTQAMLLSAGWFAVAHLAPVIMPAIFVLGVILAYVFEHRGSLAATATAHAVYNLVGFVVILTTR